MIYHGCTHGKSKSLVLRLGACGKGAGDLQFSFNGNRGDIPAKLTLLISSGHSCQISVPDHIAQALQGQSCGLVAAWLDNTDQTQT
jgi:hypothetical protein